MILLGGVWAEMRGGFSDLSGTKFSFASFPSGRQAAHDPEVEDPVCHQRPGPGVSRGAAEAANLPDQHRPEGGKRHQVLPWAG